MICYDVTQSPLSLECKIQMLHAGSKPVQHISMLDPVCGQKSPASGTLSDILPPIPGPHFCCFHPPLGQLCFCLLFLRVRIFSPIPGCDLDPLLRPLEPLLSHPMWRHSAPCNHALPCSLALALLLARVLLVCCFICCSLVFACFPNAMLRFKPALSASGTLAFRFFFVSLWHYTLSQMFKSDYHELYSFGIGC